MRVIDGFRRMDCHGNLLSLKDDASNGANLDRAGRRYAAAWTRSERSRARYRDMSDKIERNEGGPSSGMLPGIPRGPHRAIVSLAPTSLQGFPDRSTWVRTARLCRADRGREPPRTYGRGKASSGERPSSEAAGCRKRMRPAGSARPASGRAGRGRGSGGRGAGGGVPVACTENRPGRRVPRVRRRRPTSPPGGDGTTCGPACGGGPSSQGCPGPSRTNPGPAWRLRARTSASWREGRGGWKAGSSASARTWPERAARSSHLVSLVESEPDGRAVSP